MKPLVLVKQTPLLSFYFKPFLQQHLTRVHLPSNRGNKRFGYTENDYADTPFAGEVAAVA